MDKKITLLKEAGKLSAYIFVTIVLARTILVQGASTGAAFNDAFKK